ncbi:MAG: GTPase domain-containing protein [Lachnospiraceae bacterium]|nr:GTPase domain-containing protein [Lachnospiraceae bacterium]
MQNILCEKNEHMILNQTFEEFKILLQDSDATEEKEMVKNNLKRMADTTTYLILGDEGAGKTTLLNAVFQDMASFSDHFAGEMCEYRWGEQELLTPLSGGMQKKFVTTDNMRGISIVDTKGIDQFSTEAKIKVKEQIERSSAVFVVFSAENIRSPRLWDVLEGCPQKRMIFFLTKCDLLSQEALQTNIEKVKRYMQDSGISAPIFSVSMKMDGNGQGVTAIDDVRAYIRDNVVGKNPILNKQMENVAQMKEIIVQLKDSFSLRRQQYEADYQILQKINQSLDEYVLNHKKFLDGFISKVAAEINKDIDNYEREIISKLDPYKIKERFQKREDFEAYLNMVNENYRTMMSDSINRKTIEAIKSCLHDLEIVFNEATGYFNTRENILALNDKFYGSLSSSRRQMSDETREMVVSTGELYRTLRDASETLFMQIWNERKKYDNKIRNSKTISTVGGGAVGLYFATVLGATAGSVAGVCLLAIGTIVGAIALRKLAKDLYTPLAANQMEETTQKCIEQFKEEVNHTRVEMIEQVTSQITTIFENELTSVDNCFAEFRMSVNIDERKIPLLEQKMQEAEELLLKIENI